jgi:hypothetical protein
MDGSADPFIYSGLTSHTPTLRLSDRIAGSATGHGAQINLDFALDQDSTTGAGFLIESDDKVTVPTVFIANSTTPGQVPITLSWQGDAALGFHIHAFRYDRGPDGALAHYTGYAHSALPTTGAKPAWKAEWTTPPFDASTVSVSASLPGEYQIFQSSIRMRLDGARHGQIFAYSTATGPTVSFTVPALAGATFDVEVCASGEAASCRTVIGLEAGTKEAAVDVERGPLILAPTLGGTVGVGSTIQWSNEGDGAMFALLYPEKHGEGHPSYFFATDGDSFTIPDLSRMGVTLPHGAAYTLDVFRNGAAESVDALAEQGSYARSPDEPSTYAYSFPQPVSIK